MVLVEGQPRERLEARWQIMMFAAGRVAPALRGRQSCRTNDRSRPTARRTSSGRARGSRASNKPCPRASLLHRVPNERNRVDARALGREWFLESWSSKRVACGLSSTLFFSQNAASRSNCDLKSPLYQSLPLNLKYIVDIKSDLASLASANGTNVAKYGDLVALVWDLKTNKRSVTPFQVTGMELTMPCLRGQSVAS